MEDKPKLTRTGTAILDPPNTIDSHTKRSSSVLSRYPSRLLKASSVFTQNESELKSDDWLDTYLTKDILFFIFTMLKRNDLARASMVCKRWRAITNDPYFGWIRIVTCEASLSCYLYAFLRKQDQWHELAKGFTSGEIVAEDIRPTKVGHDPEHYCGSYTVVTKQGKDIPECHVTNDHPIKLASLYPHWKTHPKLWRCTLEVKSITHHSFSWEVIVELNVKEFEDTVRRNQPVPGAEKLIEIITEENKIIAEKRLQTVVAENGKGEHIPKKSTVPHKQTGLREGLNLHKYQLEAIAWMKSIEDDVQEGLEFKNCSLIPWRSAKTEILLDVVSKKFVTFDTIPQYVTNFTPRGGVLADEMGLGKTIEMLGLIVGNPSELDVTEVAKRAPKKKTRPGKNKNNENKKPDEANQERPLIDSVATLIVCPNHLTEQWQNEILNNANPPLKVFKFTTVKEYDKATPDDIATADVVIVSIQFLNNNNYSDGRFKKMLCDFRWHRMIVDEGHEVLCQLTYFSNTHTANYYWYVTGTPFPSAFIILLVLNYLQFPCNLYQQEYHKQWPLADLLISNLYWRNTKASVKDEYKTPPYVEELVALDFTDIERAIYDDYGVGQEIEKQRILCSQITKMDERNNLTTVRKHCILDAKSKLGSSRKSLQRYSQMGIRTRSKLKLKKEDCDILVEREKKNIERYTALLNNLKNSLVIAEKFLTVWQALNVTPPEEILQKVTREAAEKKLQDKVLFADDENVDSPTNSNNHNNNNITTNTVTQITLPINAPQQQQDETRPKPEEKKEEATEENKAPALSEKDIQKMTVAQLKAELTSRGIKPKGVKADLQAQLRLHVTGGTATEVETGKKSQITDARRSTRKRNRNQQDDEEPPKKAKASKSKDTAKSNDDEEDSTPRYDITKKRTTVELVQELLELIEVYGTKMGNLIYYLRRLWEQTPDARVIIFSQFDTVLHEVSEILQNNDIGTCFVHGNVMKKDKALKAFKAADSEVRVIMLSIEKAASGTNLVEASHVVLMDPVTGTKEEAQSIEAQAIARAYRQGQNNQVTLVRFIIKDTIEHEMYVKNYLDNDESQFHGRTKDLSPIHKAIAQVNKPQVLKKSPSEVKPKMIKATSIGNLLATTPVHSIGAVLKLIEESPDSVVGESLTSGEEDTTNRSYFK